MMEILEESARFQAEKSFIQELFRQKAEAMLSRMHGALRQKVYSIVQDLRTRWDSEKAHDAIHPSDGRVFT